MANENLLADLFSVRVAAPKKPKNKFLKRVHYKIRPTSCNLDDEWELYGKDWRQIKHMIATGKSKRGAEIGYIEKGYIEYEYSPDGELLDTYYPDGLDYETIYEHPILVREQEKELAEYYETQARKATEAITIKVNQNALNDLMNNL